MKGLKKLIAAVLVGITVLTILVIPASAFQDGSGEDNGSGRNGVFVWTNRVSYSYRTGSASMEVSLDQSQVIPAGFSAEFEGSVFSTKGSSFRLEEGGDFVNELSVVVRDARSFEEADGEADGIFCTFWINSQLAGEPLRAGTVPPEYVPSAG